MLSLFRTVCSTDWKGRPSHSLLLLLASDNRDLLIAKQDEDVEEWQREELEALAQMAEEEGTAAPTEWALANVRWEMDRLNEKSLRSFVEKDTEGGIFTTVYHICLVDFDDGSGARRLS